MAIARQEPTVDTWHSLYKETWKGNIVDAAFQHPAKFSKALIFKIVDHAISEGWVRKGDTVIDPFGGVGLGGLPCGLRGLHHVGVELEPRFVTLANGGECGGDIAKHEACTDAGEHGPHHILGNLELWQRKYGVLPQWRQPILVQGDSRELGKIIAAHTDLLVSSSPYLGGGHHNGQMDSFGGIAGKRTTGHFSKDDHGYGLAHGQLEAMPPGSLDAALVASSPPYANGCTHTGGADPQPQHVRGGPLRYVQYGADCTVSSPPFLDERAVHGRNASSTDEARAGRSVTRFNEYGTSTGQLGNMPTGDVAVAVQGDAAIVSPPYEDSWHDAASGNFAERCRKAGVPEAQIKRYGNGRGMNLNGQAYGASPDQLGNTQGTTFWEAAREIVAQTFQILKPGAHAVWVTKHYIRDSQLVDFPGDWRKLCEAVGFVTLHIHLAMLVERRTVLDLFEGTRAYEDWFESFFRKINRRKSGIGIEFETVICQVKPLTAAPMPPDEAWQQLPLVADCSVSSPSYGGNEKSDYLLSADGKTRQRDERRGYVQGHGCFRGSETYGQTDGQLGAMQMGNLDCALSSPPYAESLTPGNRTSTHEHRQALATEAGHGRLGGGQLTHPARYSFNPDNLGNLPEGAKP